MHDECNVQHQLAPRTCPEATAPSPRRYNVTSTHRPHSVADPDRDPDPAGAEPVEDADPDPAADPAADPVADPAADPDVDPVADPAADPVADPVADSAADSDVVTVAACSDVTSPISA